MNFQKILSQASQYLVVAVRIQLFATLVSIIILTYWGLPSSTLTVLGNLIFTPILALFLLISSGIFFLEILHLPNQSLIHALDWLTEQWLTIIPHQPQKYLIAFPKATWWIFLIGLMLAFSIMLVVKLTPTRQAALFGLILLTCTAISKLPFWRRSTPLILTYRRKIITITPTQRELIISDTGTLNFAAGSANWIQYTLVPSIIQEFGTLQIDRLEIGKSSKSTCKNLALLQKLISIKEIIQKI
jgi:hypothetical protein